MIHVFKPLEEKMWLEKKKIKSYKRQTNLFWLEFQLNILKRKEQNSRLGDPFNR